MTYYTHIFRTPVGDLYTAVNERRAVARLLFAKEGRMAALESGLEGTIVRDAARCRHVVDQIEEYFSGVRRAFDLAITIAYSAVDCPVLVVRIMVSFLLIR